jgi:hypothetical protein
MVKKGLRWREGKRIVGASGEAGRAGQLSARLNAVRRHQKRAP